MAAHEAQYQRIHPSPAADVESQQPPPARPNQKPISTATWRPPTHPPPIRPPPPPPLAAGANLLKKPKRSCCSPCKCVCWTLAILLLLTIVLAATVGAIYLIFKPKVPNYSVDSLRITDLTLNMDLSLTAKFDVRVTADNPNDKIGIYYEKGGLISVWYQGTSLCVGPIPRFYQGHRNVTRLHVALAGRNQYGSAVMSAIQQQQATGRIPLELRIHAPVAVKLGALKMRKVKVLGKCLLVVDSLSSSSKIRIQASDCKFKLKL
ncbi:unnamed protein product [Linum trigynum]|uniref:Late embryogenesis abundant protein LEA-2 subgroup domain-containing protein n=1 Tax=Linum trigynum TaxID=586398 RepID=A0AAV2D8J7_9ROSI